MVWGKPYSNEEPLTIKSKTKNQLVPNQNLLIEFIIKRIQFDNPNFTIHFKYSLILPLLIFALTSIESKTRKQIGKRLVQKTNSVGCGATLNHPIKNIKKGLFHIWSTELTKLSNNKNKNNITYKKYKKTTLIRPLLVLSRVETKTLCNFWNLPIFPDKTNLQLKYRRNRIRYQLLPTLKLLFNPKVDNVLLEFSKITNKKNFYAEFLTKKNSYK